MEDFKKLVQGILKRETHVNKLKDQIGQFEKTDEEAWKLVREGILEGETFGDPISDFVIVTHGKRSPEIVEKFNKLNRMFIGKAGQFFLVAHDKQVCQQFSGNDEVNFVRQEEYILGVATGESLKFDLQKRKFSFPSSDKCATSLGAKLEFHQKNAAEMLESYQAWSDNDEELLVIVGDDEVVEYLQGKYNIPQLCKSSIFLEKSLDKLPKIEACLVGMQGNEIRELYLVLAQYSHLKTKLAYSGEHLNKEEQCLLIKLNNSINTLVQELKSLGVDVCSGLLPLLVEKISLECEATLLGAVLGIDSPEHVKCLERLAAVNEKLPLIPKIRKL